MVALFFLPPEYLAFGNGAGGSLTRSDESDPRLESRHGPRSPRRVLLKKLLKPTLWSFGRGTSFGVHLAIISSACGSILPRAGSGGNYREATARIGREH